MAKEITVRVSITINKDNLQWRWPFPGSFQADLAVSKGPSPGYLDIPTTGRQIYFTELTNPHFCIIWNVGADTDNGFEVGVYDSDNREVHPLMRFMPGEGTVIPLSHSLGEEYSGSGTGTTAPRHYLHCRALTPGPEPGSGGTAKGFIGAFEL